MNNTTYRSYVSILEHELVPALGCTEPIAIAFAAAKAREALGQLPERLTLSLSGNIIKNAKSVTVPNSAGRRGPEIAAILGCVGGDAALDYQVLSPITSEDIQQADQLRRGHFCKVKHARGRENLFIHAEAFAGQSSATVTIENEHLGITRITKNGAEVYASADANAEGTPVIDKSALNVRDILAFAHEVNLEDVRPMLERQIAMNTAISQEGLKGGYGAEVGPLLMDMGSERVADRAAARAAAGSEARMNGCSLPVVINSGSGNQGMTVTLPLCEYAETWGKDQDTLLRALALANLISVHIKQYIGNLSAFCGAVSAACGAACGIAYMDGLGYEQICMTITNTLCNVGGIVCDGAKSSCAAKIASSVQAATLAYQLAKRGKTFCMGDGLVGADVEETIRNIGAMAHEGMCETDVKILSIMVEDGGSGA